VPRIKPRVDESPLYVVFTGPGAYAVAYYLDDPSPAYREGFVSGLTDEAHLDNAIVVICPDCESDRITGSDHEFFKRTGIPEPVSVACQKCARVFLVAPNGREAELWEEEEER